MELMLKSDLLQKRQFLSVTDLMGMFGCGRTKATAILKGIKSVSDIASLAGKVTVSDYLAWYYQKYQPQQE